MTQQQPTPPNVKKIIRLALLLSSVAMLVLAGLTFGRVIGLPVLAGYVFLAVAVTDIGIGLSIFRD